MTNQDFIRKNNTNNECQSCGAPYQDQLPWVKVENNFTLISHLKMGHLFSCQECDTYWYLNESQHSLYQVQDTRLIDMWYDEKFTADDKIRAVLSQIGGIENTHPYHLDFPCAVTLKDGTYFETAVIRFSKEFPTFKQKPLYESIDDSLQTIEYEPVRFVTEISEINISPYALSNEERLALKFNYYDVYFNLWEDDDKDEYSINGNLVYFYNKHSEIPYLVEYPTYFIKNTELNGADAKLMDRPSGQHEIKKLDNNADIKYIYANWCGFIENYNLNNLAPFLSNMIKKDTDRTTIPQNTNTAKLCFRNIGHFKIAYTYDNRNLGKLIDITDSLGKTVVNLIFNGTGFRETAEAWDNFNDEYHVGIITYQPHKKFDDLQTRAMIFYNKLQEKQGYYLLQNFDSDFLEALKEYKAPMHDMDELLKKITDKTL